MLGQCFTPKPHTSPFFCVFCVKEITSPRGFLHTIRGAGTFSPSSNFREDKGTEDGVTTEQAHVREDTATKVPEGKHAIMFRDEALPAPFLLISRICVFPCPLTIVRTVDDLSEFCQML